jgi:hypothetical protein
MAKKMKARRQQRRPGVPIMLEETKGGVVVREEEEQDGGDASGKAAALLPRHLIDEMVWYLGTLESARLAVVCKSWAATVSLRLSNPAPHIFAFRATATHRRGVIIEAPRVAGSSRLRASTTPAHRLLGRVTRRTSCLGATAGGRLVLANTSRTVLFNPVSGTFRRVKKFPAAERGNEMPVVPLGGGDAFFHARWDRVGFWRPEDDEWRVKRVGYAESLRMAALCGGSVFALDAEGYVFRFALPTLDVTKLASVPILVDHYPSAFGGGGVGKGYLVEADGAVHFVWPVLGTRRVARRDVDPDDLLDSDGDFDEDDDYLYEDARTVRGFEVYRLDVAEARWVELQSLAADRALFVSRWSSFSVRASEKGCAGNCVYFVCDEGDGKTWGAFSLAEGRILFEHDIGTGSYKERLWFYPRPRDDMDSIADCIDY